MPRVHSVPNSNQGIADELLSRLAEGPLPDVIYHYTTPRGLLGIFDSRSIWCTDIRFLNDSREVAFTVEFSRDLLEGKVATATGARKNLYDRWRRDVWVLSHYPTFVASFSEEDDLLSQWRAYGTLGGFSVGFVSSRLVSLADQFPLPTRLIRCIYEVAEQRRYLELAIDRLGELYERSGSNAAAFKHPKFSEEKEWRLIVHGLVGQVHEVGGVERRFRPGASTIIPYLEFPITSGADPLAIKIVVAGPGPAMILSGEGLGGLMEQSNLPSDALRAASTIPYRNW